MRFRIVFAKIITFIVALQILNISIYAQDDDVLEKKGVNSVLNEINSVAEYVGEVILKHNDAFPEYPDTGQKDMQLKHVDISTFTFERFKAIAKPEPFVEYLHPDKIDYNFLFFKEINPPPPKA